MQMDDCYAYNSVKTSESKSDGCQLIKADEFVSNSEYDAVIDDDGKYITKRCGCITICLTII